MSWYSSAQGKAHQFWGYDHKTGRVHLYRGATDNPRDEFGRLFGRAVHCRDGDAIGLFELVKADDTAEHLFVYPYYGVSVPRAVKDRLQTKYPHAVIRYGLPRKPMTWTGPRPQLPVPEKQSAAHWARKHLGLPKVRRWFGQPLRVVTAEASMTGCMVALYPGAAVAKRLAIPDAEPPERLHITLAYFADQAKDRTDWNEVPRILQRACQDYGKLEGEISGYGVFRNPKEGDVLWAHPDVPKLAAFRQEVAEALQDSGFSLSTEHGWTPHITLLYGHEGDLPKLEKPIPCSFDSVYFVQGDKKAPKVSLD